MIDIKALPPIELLELNCLDAPYPGRLMSQSLNLAPSHVSFRSYTSGVLYIVSILQKVL
jgi:hypothetical protein